MSSPPPPHPMSAQIRFLSHFANLKLTGDRVVRDAVHSLTPDPATNSQQPTRNPRPQRRRRVRRYKHASSRRINAMSDADLEAELAARRTARLRERERYTKAMRSEKLTLLESELLRLRSEISRLDRTTPLGGGTPPNSRWESLPNDRRSSRTLRGRMNAQLSPSHSATPSTPVVHGSVPGASPPRPPSTPPPPPPGDPDFDPEKQRREKLERQLRREAKRKEREAAKKPLTLADIIKSAGPNPAGRLKPSGSTPLEDVNEAEAVEQATFADLKDSLKKADPVSNPAESADSKSKEDQSEFAELRGSLKKTASVEQSKPTDDSEPKEKENAQLDTNDTTSEQSREESEQQPEKSKEKDQPLSSNSSDNPKPAKDQGIEIAPKSGTSSVQAPKPNTNTVTSDKNLNVSDADAANKPKPNQDANAISKSEEKDVIKPKGTSDLSDSATPLPNGNSASHPDQPNASEKKAEDNEKKLMSNTEAVSALSALAAKLPSNTPTNASPADANTNQEAQISRRLSLQEKRRMRRAAKESSSIKND